MAGRVVAGVDLGGTKIYTAIADSGGALISEIMIPTNAQRGPAAVIDDIVMTIDRALSDAGLKRGRLKAVGIGAPGPVDFKTGVVEDPPNLHGWKHVSLRTILAGKVGTVVHVDNDANLAGLAEVRFGAAVGLTEVVYVTASTGVGGGLVLGGRLYRGADGAAGEVGHMTVMPGGPLCGCGNRGCLEAVGSGTAFMKKYGYGAQEAGALARAGDETARTQIAELAGMLGLGLANLANIFNPQAIVVGGGLSNLGPLLFVPLRKAVREYGFSVAGRNVRILRARLGKRVGVMGAIALALDEA
ncbi:MAG: ROK family protein [Myxococcota bacterium]|jgi:glucokinase